MLFYEPVGPDEVAAHPTIARLAELGWIEGQTITIERAYANADIKQLAALAQGLVRKRPNVIWVDDPEGALAVARATSTIPIIFCGVPFPVESGLIDSLARPGRNLTGVANAIDAGMSTRRIAMLKEIAPKATRLAWLFPGDLIAADKAPDLTPYEADARKIGFEPSMYVVHLTTDMDAVFRDMIARRMEALSVGESPTLLFHRDRIVGFATSNRLPSAFLTESFVQAGGLLSFGPDRTYTRKSSAEYIDRVLRGANPATTPVERPSRFTTVVNLKTARMLGLTIPPSVLLNASRVIE